MICSVINMDIVNSRENNNRIQIQNIIKNYLNTLSNRYKKDLLSPITITLGDEWQIVLKNISKSYTIITEINEFLNDYNIKTYSGIGIGSISTEVYSNSSNMDGEAFINARNAINIAKKSGDTIKSKVNRVYLNEYSIIEKDEVAVSLVSDGGYPTVKIGYIINALIENTEILINKVTPKQWVVIKSYREAYHIKRWLKMGYLIQNLIYLKS